MRDCLSKGEGSWMHDDSCGGTDFRVPGCRVAVSLDHMHPQCPLYLVHPKKKAVLSEQPFSVSSSFYFS
jgi:hypothetical protein